MANSNYENEDCVMEHEEYEVNEIPQQSKEDPELSSNEITSTVPDPEDIYEVIYPGHSFNQNYSHSLLDLTNNYDYEEDDDDDDDDEEDEVVEERILQNNPVGCRCCCNHPPNRVIAPGFLPDRETNALPNPTPDPEYAIPLVNLSQPGVRERLLQSGIQHYISVRDLQNTNLHLPAVSVLNLQMSQLSSYLFDVCDFLKVEPDNVHPMD